MVKILNKLYNILKLNQEALEKTRVLSSNIIKQWKYFEKISLKLIKCSILPIFSIKNWTLILKAG